MRREVLESVVWALIVTMLVLIAFTIIVHVEIIAQLWGSKK